MLDMTRSMRAGGYRMTVATIGRYEESSPGDELEILDRQLQEGLAQMIHMLYLDEISNQANAEADARLSANLWDYRQDLPHIGMVLGAENVFRRLGDGEEDKDDDTSKRGKKGGKKGGNGTLSQAKHRHVLAKHFFDILGRLPQNHIVHDTAIGLQLPELIGENQWIYIADPEETFLSFNRALSHVYDKFNGISLSRLNGHADACDEIKASVFHMRGYGDRLNDRSESFYRRAALALN